MTECTGGPFLFSSLKRQKIVADFDGGRLTSDAGALLLREADRRTGLTKALAACIADPRDPAKIRHDLRTLLAQRIFGIALGYEDLNDHQTLRDDPLHARPVHLRQEGGQKLLRVPVCLQRLEERIERCQVREGVAVCLVLAGPRPSQVDLRMLAVKPPENLLQPGV